MRLSKDRRLNNFITTFENAVLVTILYRPRINIGTYNLLFNKINAIKPIVARWDLIHYTRVCGTTAIKMYNGPKTLYVFKNKSFNKKTACFIYKLQKSTNICM